MRRAHQLRAARIDDDELGALAQPLLDLRADDGMGVGRIAADDQNDVGLRHRVEILRAGRRAEGLAQAIAGRRMANARACVDIIIAEAAADQLLHEIGFLDRAARRGDAADGKTPVFRLNPLELRGGVIDRLLPTHLAPGIGDLFADHRGKDAVAVQRIAIGEAALDAAMAVIGLAVLPGNHAHDLLAAHLGLESAADAAIGAGGDGRMFGLADLDDRILDQRRRGAGLNAGAAGDAFRLHDSPRPSPGETRLSKPRPSIVSANVPCTSEQARTQRLQTMHFEGS